MANKRLVICVQELQEVEPEVSPDMVQPENENENFEVVDEFENQENPQAEDPEIVSSDPEIYEQEFKAPPEEEMKTEPEKHYVEASLLEGEYPNTYVDHEVTPDELNHAIDVIISTCYQQKTNSITVDLDEREKENSMQEREMSLQEIEEALGCKIKIVNKEDWSDYGRE